MLLLPDAKLLLLLRHSQLFEAEVGVDFVDNSLNDSVHLRAVAVIRCADVIYAVVANERCHLLASSLILRIVDRDGVSAKVLHEAHTRDVGRSVTHIYHIAEWHGTFTLLDVAIDHRAVEYRLHALVDLEDKLCLVGVVDRHSGPIGDAVDIVEELAGVNLAELVSNLRTLDNLGQTRRVDIVHHIQSSLSSIGVDAREPLFDALIELNPATRLLECFATQRESLGLCLLNHLGHVCKDAVGILLLGKRVSLVPKLLVALANGRDKVILLHIARREGAVKIVNKCYCRSIAHSFSIFTLKDTKNMIY